jgi:hypothetical protein
MAHKGSARNSASIPSAAAEGGRVPTSLLPSVRIMAVAYDTGVLPNPMPPPSKDVDQAAVELARQVLERNESSTRALMTALQMSGFSVRDQDGKILLTSIPQGQGIYFDAEQVAGMAKEFGAGLQVKLADLGDAFQASLPELKNGSLRRSK